MRYSNRFAQPETVVPAQAGTQAKNWISAFAGMTCPYPIFPHDRRASAFIGGFLFLKQGLA